MAVRERRKKPSNMKEEKRIGNTRPKGNVHQQLINNYVKRGQDCQTGPPSKGEDKIIGCLLGRAGKLEKNKKANQTKQVGNGHNPKDGIETLPKSGKTRSRYDRKDEKGNNRLMVVLHIALNLGAKGQDTGKV